MSEAEQGRPFVIIIAGPNGSGKTTLTNQLREQGLDLGEYINADEITAELLAGTPSPTPGRIERANRQAQRLADERRQAALEDARSLSFETVMSHPSKIELMEQARARGYDVRLFFVGVDDPAINLERVALRVQQGGHDVPPGKIIERYERVMERLPDAVRASDQAVIFDNSRDDDPLRMVAAIQQGREVVMLMEVPPHWFRARLLDKLGHALDTAAGPNKALAGDFRRLDPVELEQSYREHPGMMDALRARAAVEAFARERIQLPEAQQRFVEVALARIAYNLEHGLPNPQPTLRGEQDAEPLFRGNGERDR